MLTQMDRPQDQLPLSSVVCVKACPLRPGEDKAVFDFEVHFTKYKGSPWTLRAYTQVTTGIIATVMIKFNVWCTHTY